MGDGTETSGVRGMLGAFFSLERDVLVLSLALFLFSLAFQATTRYLPEYLATLGAGSVAIGVFGTLGNLLSAAYPYPGGAFSDRIGSRSALTLFGLLSTAGFALWLVAGHLPTLSVLGLAIPAWAWIFVGLVFAQAWKSLGLGATFAVVKQATDEARLAAGFASTETVRRLAFLAGPLLAALVLQLAPGFPEGFQAILGLAVVFALVGTLAQHLLYTPQDTAGERFQGLDHLRQDLRDLPDELGPLLVSDTLVRFANGMVYVFFVIVVTRFLSVDATVLGVHLAPEVYFGVLLGIEMIVALLTMGPAARLAEEVGLKPVVATGFLVYALFPVLLINAPADALVVGGLFAFSGLRFAGLPAHKALIVGPAQEHTGGRVTGAYYLLRNVIVVPSGALGGWLYAIDPELAFSLATLVGLAGTGVFLVFGRDFEPYTRDGTGEPS